MREAETLEKASARAPAEISSSDVNTKEAPVHPSAFNAHHLTYSFRHKHAVFKETQLEFPDLQALLLIKVLGVKLSI